MERKKPKIGRQLVEIKVNKKQVQQVKVRYSKIARTSRPIEVPSKNDHNVDNFWGYFCKKME